MRPFLETGDGSALTSSSSPPSPPPLLRFRSLSLRSSLVRLVSTPLPHQIIEAELEGFGIRLNKQPPNIVVRKKERGGIAMSNTVPLTKIEPEEIRAVLSEYKISNADVMFRCDPTLDEFIDVIEGGRVYIPCLYVLNKIDAISIEELGELDGSNDEERVANVVFADLLYKIPNSVPVSARDWLNVDELVEVRPLPLSLLECQLIRELATDDVGEARPRSHLHQAQGPHARLLVPRRPSPQPLHRQGLLRQHPQGHLKAAQMCVPPSLSFSRYGLMTGADAMVFGSSVKHSRGQKVGLDHQLADEDVVSLVKN